MPASASIPPTPQPEDAEAVDHRGVRVGADQGVRAGPPARPPSSRSRTPFARYSRFTWWTMPVAGGTTRKPSKAFWPQRRNSYRSRLRSNSISAFRRAASRRAEDVHLHRVVHHEVHRHQRVDLLRVLAEAVHRRPQRREVHDRRHPGEVLQDDPGADLQNTFKGQSLLLTITD